MRHTFLLVLATFVVPVSAAAQAEALGVPRVNPPPAGVDPEIIELQREADELRQTTRAPSEGVEQTEETVPEPTPGQASVGRTIGGTLLGFGVGMGAGSLAGFAASFAICQSDPFCLIIGLIGAGVGAATFGPLGAGIGAWGLSDAGGGSGNAFAAVGGAYLGAGVGVAVAAAVWNVNPPAALIAGPLIGFVLANVGAVLGYQLTQGDPSEHAFVMPTLNVAENGDGVVLGAAGAF